MVVAVLLGLTALAYAISPPPDPAPVRSGPAADPSGGAVAPAEPSDEIFGPAEPGLVTRTIDAGEAPETVDIAQGTRLRLAVEADVLDAVAIEELDRIAAVSPDAPAVFELKPDRLGTFDITLLEAGTTIGRLQVNRAG